MRKFLILFLLTLLFTALIGESVNELLEKGFQNFEEGKYAVARDYFLNAIEESGVKTPEHCYWLGKSYIALQEYEKAFEMFDYFSKNYLGKEATEIKGLLKILQREVNQADTVGVYFTLGRLPSYMNSRLPDSAPVLSEDGNEMFFTSERNSEDNENVWKSVKIGSKWGTPILVRTLSSDNNEAIASITNNGKTAYLFGNYEENDELGDIYVSQKRKKKWQNPEKINSVSSDFVEMHPYVYKDSLMFFTSVNNLCYGESDLFVSEKSGDRWGMPVNLGPIINTAEYEQTPFLDFDGETLYFASNGHFGFGGFDIFKSKKIGDTWQDWSQPQNLGVRINSVRDDRYFVKDKYSDSGYLSSTRAGGVGGEDIYTFNLSKIEVPEYKKEDVVENIYVFGNIYCDSIPANELNVKEFSWDYFADDIGYREMVRVDSLGNYKIGIKKGADSYSFTVVAEKCFTIVNTLIPPDDQELIEYDIPLTKIIEEKAYEISNINFETNKAILKESSFASLDKLVRTLKNNKEYLLEISGHTDNVGNNSSNKKLSIRRAEAVVNYFIENKVSESKLIAIGFGEDKPIKTNDTKEGRAANRRVEMKFSKDADAAGVKDLRSEIEDLNSKIESARKKLEKKEAEINSFSKPNPLKKSEILLKGKKDKVEKLQKSEILLEEKPKENNTKEEKTAETKPEIKAEKVKLPDAEIKPAETKPEEVKPVETEKTEPEENTGE